MKQDIHSISQLLWDFVLSLSLRHAYVQSVSYHYLVVISDMDMYLLFLKDVHCTLQIKVTSHDHYDISNHWQLDCLFNCLFRLALKTCQSPHNWPFVRGIHQSLVDSPHKGPVTRKAFPCRYIIMQRIYPHDDIPHQCGIHAWPIPCKHCIICQNRASLRNDLVSAWCCRHWADTGLVMAHCSMFREIRHYNNWVCWHIAVGPCPGKCTMHDLLWF